MANVDTPTAILKSPLRRYGLALLLIVLAIAFRAWLDPMLGVKGVGIFLVAILAGAWYGGLGAALLCLITLQMVHGYGFTNPPRLWDPTVESAISTGIYYIVGITAGLFSDLRTAAQLRAREQQVEALGQREHLRATLSCMAEGVLVTDAQGRITLVNSIAETMTGWQLAEAKGKQLHEVFAICREDGQKNNDNPVQRVLRDERAIYERMRLLLVSRTGQKLPIAYSAAPVQGVDGHVRGVVLVLRDESERRRTELSLHDADRRKDEFLATLAHELRNPLAPISMGLELLKLSADDPAAMGEIYAMMQRQTQHMVRLIDDLLDVSRITRGKLELRRSQVEFSENIRNAVEASKPLLDDRKHHLITRLPEQPLLLYADASRLTQVFTNLLQNAAKYTPSEGRIEISAEQVGGEVKVRVSDTGLGIPTDKLDCVFEMFAQINETSESGHAGLGIGLTLVKRLVELHGGSVEVQSPGLNLGTTFHVRLPVLSEAVVDLTATPQRLDGPRLAKRRVLVVDDNADALASLSRMVSLLGNDVRRAKDGVEALEIARTFLPDTVLMDLGMPRMNGYEAARRMREEPWGANLALVATTGWGQEEDRRRTAEAGFDRHLVKPIVLASLEEVFAEPSRED